MDKHYCVVCGIEITEDDLVLDLGDAPLANGLVFKEDLDKVKLYPLKYYTCSECSLLQQIDLVSDKVLFTKYLYLTSANKGLIPHYKKMCYDLTVMAKTRKLAYVIASNDYLEGTLLKEEGFKEVYGIEPSDIGKNRPYTINKFFSYKLSKDLRKQIGKADLIMANNVMAHTPNPKDMLQGMANLIKDDGIISIQVNWLKPVIENLEIEVLYHEHYFVWSVKAMHHLTRELGLKLAKVIYLPQEQGGSVRFIIKKQHKGAEDLSLMFQEEQEGLYNPEYLKKIVQKKAEKRRDAFVGLINELKRQKKIISIWSCPAKITTLLNFYNITNKEISYAYEVAETKIGKYIPKADIEIKSEKGIMKDMPNYLIIGAWNYMDVAKKVLQPYLKAGGILINPLSSKVIRERYDIRDSKNRI